MGLVAPIDIYGVFSVPLRTFTCLPAWRSGEAVRAHIPVRPREPHAHRAAVPRLGPVFDPAVVQNAVYTTHSSPVGCRLGAAGRRLAGRSRPGRLHVLVRAAGAAHLQRHKTNVRCGICARGGGSGREFVRVGEADFTFEGDFNWEPLGLDVV